MILEELHQLPMRPGDLRKFGLLVGGVACALGGWLLYRHRPTGPWCLGAGAVLLIFGLVAPRALKPIYVAWMALALALGLLLTALLLTILFFGMITPISWVARLLGKDFLSLRRDARAPTYWRRRQEAAPRQPEDYEQQF